MIILFRRNLLAALFVLVVGLMAAMHYGSTSAFASESVRDTTLTAVATSQEDAHPHTLPVYESVNLTYGYVDNYPEPSALSAASATDKQLERLQTIQAAAVTVLLVMSFMLITSIRFRWPFRVQ